MDNASSARIRSRGSLSWKKPAVLATTVMEEEECSEDGSSRPACGRKRSREESLRGSRGRTMLLRYRRDVAAARTSNQYGVIGYQVLVHETATCRVDVATNDPPRR